MYLVITKLSPYMTMFSSFHEEKKRKAWVAMFSGFKSSCLLPNPEQFVLGNLEWVLG